MSTLDFILRMDIVGFILSTVAIVVWYLLYRLSGLNKEKKS
jgi:hypothetical protein